MHLKKIDEYYEILMKNQEFLSKNFNIDINDGYPTRFPKLNEIFEFNSKNLKDLSYVILKIVSKVNFENIEEALVEIAQ